MLRSLIIRRGQRIAQSVNARCSNYSIRYASNEPMLGSVDLYHKHIFVPVPGDPSSWPAKLEKSDDPSFSLFSKIASAAKEKGEADETMKMKVTAIETNESTSELLVFPDRVKMRLSADDNNVNEIFNNINSHPNAKLPKESYIFVCAHANRDKRCGACGPSLYEALTKELQKVCLQEKVAVYKCSHVGGHKWAGNVIVFDKHGGNWYGTVTSEHVPQVVQDHLLNNKIVWQLWRGRMGMSKEEIEQEYANNNNNNNK